METQEELDLLRHAPGVQRRAGTWSQPYRNHYVAGGDDAAVWDRMVEKGLAKCTSSRVSAELRGGMPSYVVTDAGREVALAGLRMKRRNHD